MGILKDWKEDNEGYRFRSKVRNFFSPFVWFRLHKWRVQRADRGWSDRDTWGAGDHIAKMTADMLQHLNDNKYTDWDAWFDFNIDHKTWFDNLQEVIDAINDYLEFDKTSWADELTTKELFHKTEDGHYHGPDWYAGDKKLTQDEIESLINKWHENNNRKYKKAQDAMTLFARNFSGFWD